MSRSIVYLALHTAIFGSLALASLVLSYLLLTHQLPHYGTLIVFDVIVVGAAATWIPYKGSCPFTIWENAERTREGKEPYSGPCIIRYAHQWFGLRLPHNADNVLTVLVFALPTAIALIGF